LISCTSDSTCYSVVQQIAASAVPADPRQIKRTFERGGKIDLRGFSLEIRERLESGSAPLPASLADCARLLEFVAATHSKSPVVVIDEFDLINDKLEHERFANLVKMMGDQQVHLNLIFCGIGESLDELFNAHLSTHRYFHTVELPRLPYDPRLEIIDAASDALSISIDNTTRMRIAKISDGFPHYVHLLGEKLFWRAFFANN
jgi:uncharacterized protein